MQGRPYSKSLRRARRRSAAPVRAVEAVAAAARRIRNNLKK